MLNLNFLCVFFSLCVGLCLTLAAWCAWFVFVSLLCAWFVSFLFFLLVFEVGGLCSLCCALCPSLSLWLVFLRLPFLWLLCCLVCCLRFVFLLVSGCLSCPALDLSLRVLCGCLCFVFLFVASVFSSLDRLLVLGLFLLFVFWLSLFLLLAVLCCLVFWSCLACRALLSWCCVWLCSLLACCFDRSSFCAFAFFSVLGCGWLCVRWFPLLLACCFDRSSFCAFAFFSVLGCGWLCVRWFPLLCLACCFDRVTLFSFLCFLSLLGCCWLFVWSFPLLLACCFDRFSWPLLCRALPWLLLFVESLVGFALLLTAFSVDWFFCCFALLLTFPFFLIKVIWVWQESAS